MKTVIVRNIVEAAEALKQQAKLTGEVAATSEAASGLTDQLDQMTGGAITFGKKLVTSAKAGVVAMKTLRGAVIATGIGALVVAVGSLVSYFTQTERGARKLDKAFAIIGATIDVLIDRFSIIGEGIYKLFTGDVSGAVDAFKGSLQGLTAEIVAEGTAALVLEDRLQKLKDAEIELTVEMAKRRAEIKELNKIAEDTTKSDEERVNAAAKAIELENKLLDQRKANAKENFEIIKAQNSLGESSTEDRERQAEAEAEYYRIQEESLERQTTLNNKLNILEKSLYEQRMAEAERLKMQELEEIEKAGGTDIESSPELSQQEMLQQKLLESNRRFQEEKTDLEIKEGIKRRKEALMIEEQKQNAFNDILRKGLATASLIAKKGSIEQKLIAAAGATIDTFAAIVAGLKNASKAGLPLPLAIGQATATGAFGFAQVRNIMKTNPTSAGNGSFSSSGGGGSRSEPEQIQRVPDFDSINQGIGGTQNSSFKSYVLSRDIKNQRSLDERLDDLAKVS